MVDSVGSRTGLTVIGRPFGILVGLLSLLPVGLPVFAEEKGPEQTVAAYQQALTQVSADLEAGKRADARQKLDATGKSHRSFEFDYLLARTGEPADDKTPADLIRTLPKPDVETRYGVLNPLTRDVVYICRDGSLRIYSLTDLTAAPKSVAHAQAAAVWTGVFTADGKLFFSGHQNGEVLVWDAADWTLKQTVSLGNPWPVRELACAPDGSAFVAESQKELELWSLAGAEPKKVTGVGERLNFGEGLAFSPKGDLLATGGMFDINLHDAKTGEPTGMMSHASYTMGLVFSPDGQRIASAPRGNVNKFLAVFDIAQKKPLFNAGPFGNYVAGMAFTPDGRRIAATGCEKMLRLFDAGTGDVLLTWRRPECGAVPAFSRDGRLLGWSEPDGYKFIDLGPAAEKTDAKPAE